MIKLFVLSICIRKHLIIYCFLTVVFMSCNGQTQNNPVQEIVTADSIQTDTSYLIREVVNDRVTTIFPQVHTNLNGMVSQFVRGMYEDNNGNFWFGTNCDGIIRYDGKSLAKFVSAKGLGISVREIIADESGNIWFGSSDGLIKYDGKQFSNYSVEVDLIDDEIWGMSIDKTGVIWVGTVNGVSKFDGEKFTSFVVPKAEVKNPEPMLSENRISDIMIDSKNNIWFLTDGFGITIFDGESFSFLTEKNGLPDNNVADIFEDKQGNFWIGSFFGGVCRYDGNTFTNFTQDNVIEGIEAYNFCEDANGNIWFSVENVGVYKFDGKSFTKYSTEDGLTTNGVQSIYSDKKGQLWFGTWSGISIFNGKSFTDANTLEPWTK